MTYIATFYSHFGSIRFMRLCRAEGIPVQIMPVPRDLSSSCGTCARYESDRAYPQADYAEEIEQIVSVTAQGYEQVYRAKDS